MRKRSKKVITAVLAAVMAISLSACGGSTANTDGQSESSSAGGSSTSSASTDSGSGIKVQGVTDDEIIVYNSSAVSGAFAATGAPINVGIQAYFDMVNENGGIDGRKITFLHTDDEYDPVKGKAAFEEYVYNEGVFGIVGMFGSGVTQACMDDIKATGIPAVYFATGIKDLYNDHAETAADGASIFPVQPIYLTEGKIMVADAIKDFDAKSIGIIYTSDDTGIDINEGALAQAEELGIEIYSEQVAAQAEDVSAAVASILQNKPDFVIIAAAQATFPTIAKELASQGNTAPTMTTYINCVYSMCEQVYDFINGQYDLYGTAWLDYTNEEEYNNWVEASEYLGEEYALNGYSHCGWIAGYVFCEGLRRLEGQEVTWQSYIDALESEPIKNPFGGTLDFSDGKRLGTTSMYIVKANIDASTGTGWEPAYPMASLDEMLAEIK